MSYKLLKRGSYNEKDWHNQQYNIELLKSLFIINGTLTTHRDKKWQLKNNLLKLKVRSQKKQR